MPRKFAAEAVAAAAGHFGDRQAGGHGGDDRLGAATLIDAGEELFLQIHVFGERFEDEVGSGDRLFEVFAVGADRNAVGDALRLRHILCRDQALVRLLRRAGEEHDIAAAGGKHLTATRAHGPVRTEDHNVLDLNHAFFDS